ncbi:MAG: hypothetical protein ACE5R6_14105 [Candidatus Heimdallarchaeota archaeon]
MNVEILKTGYKYVDSGFFLVKEDTGEFYVHIATWNPFDKAVEEAKKLARKIKGHYIVARKKNGSGDIYKALESSY